jgi:DNA primase
MRYDKDEINELTAAIDMTAYLDEQGITYRRTHGSKGVQLNVKECPRCGNSDWKVYLNEVTGLGNCFAGDHPAPAGYNKFTFIKASLGDDIPFSALLDNMRRIAKDMGWKQRKVVAAPTAVAKESPKLPAHWPIPIQGRNLAYLTNRGIDIEIAQYFGLSFCDEGSFAYQLDGEWRFMKFDKRVIIPIYNMEGKLVSFQGRDITGKAEKKYLFPPGHSSTGEHIYNAHNFGNATEAVIGEGVFDVIAIKLALDKEASLRDVVALGTFGKHLSHGHAESQLEKFRRLMIRGLKRVTIMWDGEVKATDAAIEAGNLLRGLGLEVRIAMLPADKDPNEVPYSVVQRAYFTARPLTNLTALSIKFDRRKINANR